MNHIEKPLPVHSLTWILCLPVILVYWALIFIGGLFFVVLTCNGKAIRDAIQKLRVEQQQWLQLRQRLRLEQRIITIQELRERTKINPGTFFNSLNGSDWWWTADDLFTPYKELLIHIPNEPQSWEAMQLGNELGDKYLDPEHGQALLLDGAGVESFQIYSEFKPINVIVHHKLKCIPNDSPLNSFLIIYPEDVEFDLSQFERAGPGFREITWFHPKLLRLTLGGLVVAILFYLIPGIFLWGLPLLSRVLTLAEIFTLDMLVVLFYAFLVQKPILQPEKCFRYWLTLAGLILMGLLGLGHLLLMLPEQITARDYYTAIGLHYGLLVIYVLVAYCTPIIDRWVDPDFDSMQREIAQFELDCRNTESANRNDSEINIE